MFKSAYLRLTLFYVLIIMVISLSFSMVLYKISSNEINRGLRRQSTAFNQKFNSIPPIFSIDDLERIGNESIGDSNQRLVINLVNINIIVFALSTLFSYFLAKRTLEPIQESLEAQKRFTADASHELRTPLTAMKTEIEVSLRDKLLNLGDAKQLLASNLQEVDKLQTLSSALLKLAKLEDKTRLDLQKINLAEIVDRAQKNISKLAQKKLIKFKTSVGKIEVMGDEDTLVEVFAILLENTVKFSPKNSTVSVTGRKYDHRAVVAITDKGIGIHAQDLPYIFDRFYRADASRSKTKVDGYGLGLSIAKSIIDLHGGRISARSKFGHGSIFTVELLTI